MGDPLYFLVWPSSDFLTQKEVNVMKGKVICCLTLTAMFVLMLNLGLVAATSPPKEGDLLPLINLPVPKDPAQRSYLGLAKEGLFQIPQIKAQVVIVEIFSMY